jgi:hypothetical protein
MFVAAVTAAHGQAPPRPAVDTRTYSNSAWRWSVSYPAQWTVEAGDPTLVRIRFAERNALCSFNSGAMDRFNSADELTDFMLANDAQFFKERKQKFAVLERRRMTLPNRVVANDVLAEIGPGQKSRRVYALADGRGFAIDCEAESKNWAVVEADYQRIVASFTVRR